ncbi:MAG: hypothetical protein Tsb002_24800 [Wenzhouxiangellaceae bacterium]
MEAVFQPETGHWFIPTESGPGGGLHLTAQGNTLGVSLFSYDTAGQPIWYVGLGQIQPPVLTLQEGWRVSFVAELQQVVGGSSLELPFSAGQLIPTGRNIELVFSSTTTAQMTLDGVTKPVRLFYFGLPLALTSQVDAPLFSGIFPRVEGLWAVVDRRPGGGVIGDVRLIYFREGRQDDLNPLSDPILFSNDQSRLPGNESFLSCGIRFNSIGRESPFAHCTMSIAPMGSVQFATLSPNDIRHNRFDILFEMRDRPIAERREVFAVRIPDAEGIFSPQPGHWQVSGDDGPGSAVNISINGDQMGVSLMTYDDTGNSIWQAAIGTFDPVSGSFEAPLREAAGGSPIMLDAAQPAQWRDVGQRLKLEFNGASEAQLIIGDVEKVIRPLSFALPEVSMALVDGQFLHFPEPAGDWLLVVEFNNGQPAIIEPVTLTRELQPTMPGAIISYVQQSMSTVLSDIQFYCEEGQGENPCTVSFFLPEQGASRNYHIPVDSKSLSLRGFSNAPLSSVLAADIKRVSGIRTR